MNSSLVQPDAQLSLFISDKQKVLSANTRSHPDIQSVVNLPDTVTVSENSDTGTVVFTIQSAEEFDLINQYPAVTSEAFQYVARNKTVTIKNANLLDYNGNHRTFVLRFQRLIGNRRRKRQMVTGDLLLVIQLEDVKEAGNLASFGFSGCCDGVDTLRWMIPVCTVVEFLALLMCFAISLICPEYGGSLGLIRLTKSGSSEVITGHICLVKIVNMSNELLLHGTVSSLRLV
eukprot:XP_019928337.1 PREDICTED: uncharacterized protein LOC109620404 [Crassostrea gigas]